jgi:DNA polymerase V
MKAIVDCNSFYCSCERVFRPDLANQPVVVLSNNDGCIISRSDEAKQLGVEMAGPYFKAKPLIEKYGVHTFSSNYNLYGDMSWRVMETLRMLVGKENVEVYSIDEAFLNLDHIPAAALHGLAKEIKETVEMWTGIQVSVGVAPTKVLSKVANRLAKKNKQATECVVLLDTEEKINTALQKTMVDDIWGVGSKYAYKLHQWQIDTAYQLKNMEIEWAQKNLGGVMGVRLIKELRGETAISMEDELVYKKMIATTRMFGEPVKNISAIKEAIATYTSRAAEKLRRQNAVAKTIGIFIVKKEASHAAHFKHGPSISTYTHLPLATCVTQELIKPALQMVEKIFEADTFYKKAGVVLSDIVPEDAVQGNLFVPVTENKNRLLMNMIDNVNFSMRDDVLKFASSGTTRDWKMRQELRSKRHTTRWDELYELK